jgi:Tfp pilus assembly protein PilZ
MVYYREKRIYPRSLCKVPATIQEVEDNFLYRARLVNYNNTGMFLETDVVLESGSEIIVGVEDSLFPFQTSSATPDASDVPECYRARVIWQKTTEDSIFYYGYGAQIISEADDKSLQNADHHEKSDLRKHPRKPYSKFALFTSGKHFYKGLIKNISRRGFFVETKGVFNVGQIIKLVIPGTGIDNGVMLKGEVIRCSTTGIGVEFKSLLRKKGANKKRDGRRPENGGEKRSLKGLITKTRK